MSKHQTHQCKEQEPCDRVTIIKIEGYTEWDFEIGGMFTNIHFCPFCGMGLSDGAKGRIETLEERIAIMSEPRLKEGE